MNTGVPSDYRAIHALRAQFALVGCQTSSDVLKTLVDDAMGQQFHHRQQAMLLFSHIEKAPEAAQLGLMTPTGWGITLINAVRVFNLPSDKRTRQFLREGLSFAFPTRGDNIRVKAREAMVHRLMSNYHPRIETMNLDSVQQPVIDHLLVRFDCLKSAYRRLKFDRAVFERLLRWLWLKCSVSVYGGTTQVELAKIMVLSRITVVRYWNLALRLGLEYNQRGFLRVDREGSRGSSFNWSSLRHDETLIKLEQGKFTKDDSILLLSDTYSILRCVTGVRDRTWTNLSLPFLDEQTTLSRQTAGHHRMMSVGLTTALAQVALDAGPIQKAHQTLASQLTSDQTAKIAQQLGYGDELEEVLGPAEGYVDRVMRMRHKQDVRVTVKVRSLKAKQAIDRVRTLWRLWQFFSRPGQMALTRTKRFRCLRSSVNPLTLPKTREIRRALSRPGRYYAHFDVKSQDPYICALLFDDTAFLTRYREGADMHALTGAALRGLDYASFSALPPEEWNEWRNKAKTVNNGILYGRSAEGISDALGVDLSVAENVLRQLKWTYPMFVRLEMAADLILSEQGKRLSRRREEPLLIYGVERDNPYWRPDYQSALGYVGCKRKLMSWLVQGVAAYQSHLTLDLFMARLAEAGKSEEIEFETNIHDGFIFSATDPMLLNEATGVFESCLVEATHSLFPEHVDAGFKPRMSDSVRRSLVTNDGDDLTEQEFAYRKLGFAPVGVSTFSRAPQPGLRLRRADDRAESSRLLIHPSHLCPSAVQVARQAA